MAGQQGWDKNDPKDAQVILHMLRIGAADINDLQELSKTHGAIYQAFVEQKNGAVVRRLVGYGRFDGVETTRVLERLYAASRLHTNFFQPSFKLKDKRHEGYASHTKSE
jgi:hypothetical protein